ncbi:hypothetical protein K0U83_20475 [bacterium]|mgnify:CR=1 FL=1|jgi:hypothetical protein|nr:hypothetical protein [bacterium]
MAKIQIEIEDESGQVAVNTTITGYDENSKACQMAERILMFVDRIAERQGKPEIVPQIVHAASEINAKRIASLANIASERVIIHAG